MTANETTSCSITVKPTHKHNRPLSTQVVTLHALDLFNPPIQISNHRFFHPPQHCNAQDIIEGLKSSLAEALELYPPVAGTVRLDEKGEYYVALDGQGALFQVETCNSPFTGDGEHISARSGLLLPTPSSVFAVKVTLFSCGTIAVASSMHHLVTDLRAFLDFLGVWSKLARGESIDLQAIPQDWSRTPRKFFAGLNNNSKYNTLSPPRGYAVLPSRPTGGIELAMPEADIQHWKITGSSLSNLKNDFTSALEERDTWISSGDALTALLWGAIIRARQTVKVRSNEESETETIGTAADGRDRSPNQSMVGGRYFGNFNLLPVTAVPRRDLLSTSTESASRVALAIRKSLNEQLSAEAIADRLEFMEAQERGTITWAAGVAFTNWCRFDLLGEDMDFGWGRPFEATGGEGDLPPGYACLLQNKTTGDVTVIMTVEREGGHALKTDNLLNKYATLVKIR